MKTTIKSAIVPLKQGSQEWSAHRSRSLNASELAAAMGVSTYMTRTDLVAMKATGITPEIDDATQRRFDMGHEFEATARQWAEEIVGDDLYSNVFSADVEGLERPLSASLDGHTMAKDVIWEHKTANAKLIESLESGVIPDQYHPQIEQCLMLTGAVKCLFMASAGSRDSMRYAWYESNPDLRDRIIPTWIQLEQSIESFVPTVKTVKVEAEVVEALPAVSVRMDGQIIVSSNLDVFGARLRAFVDGLNQKPETDQDFANADAAVKALDKAESALAAAKASAISQVQSVEQMTAAVDNLIAISKAARLSMEKLVKARKDAIKTEAVMGSQSALNEHITGLNMRLCRPLMPRIAADFAEAINGKRTVDTLKAAAADELARAKTEADMMFNRIVANLKVIDATGLPQLFADLVTLVVRDPADVALLVDARVTTHKAAEAKRLEEERERIRAEEAERLQREANAAAEAAKPAPQAEPQQRTLDDAGTAIEEQPNEQRPAVVLGVGGSSRGYSVPSAMATRPAANEPEDDGVRLKLGELNALIAPVSINAEGLAILGFQPEMLDKNARIYRSCDVPAICQAIARHVTSVMQEHLLAA